MRMLKNLKINTKLNLLIILLLSGLITVIVCIDYYHVTQELEKENIAILTQKKAELAEITQLVHRLASKIYEEDSQIEVIEKEYKSKLTAVIDSVLTIVTARYKALKQSGIDEAEIQTELKSHFRNLRYDNGSGYVFVTDLEGFMIAHPDTRLDGTDTRNLQDAHGKYLIQEITAVVKKQGQGFVDYYWAKLGHQQPQLKLSYATLFKPYNWVVTTGIYIEDVTPELQQKVARLITSHRYDIGNTKNNYFFIISTEGTMVNNPAFPELQGADFYNRTDENGKYFVRDFIKVAQETGAGFVEYVWPQPVTKKTMNKISYVQLFKPFNWIIGTGLYVDDIGIKEKQQELKYQAMTEVLMMTVIGIIFLMVGVFLSLILVRSITKPLSLAGQVAKKVAEGDFAQQVRYHAQDEVGQLIVIINSMAMQLRSSYEQLADYNRDLELKVTERTQAFQVANAELQKTLESLKTMQQELIQSEKMAALGHLIAGIAHEINTPLGAIRSSIENIAHSLQGAFIEKFTVFFYTLSEEQQQIFNVLLRKVVQQEKVLTSREKRQLKRTLVTQLEAYHVAKIDNVADTLVDMGIYEEVETFLPLLVEVKEQQALQMAYELASLQKSAHTITTAVNRAAKVVFALKNFAHFDQSGEKATVDITEGIETVLTLYYNQLKHGVEVIKHYAQLPLVACYPDGLNQVWTNLIHNALQAMDNKGTLQIETALRDNDVAVSITDSGVGIPPDIKDKIFNAFFTTKPPGEGSGLGLDIVRKIIEKHAGRIEVESVPGKTTFTILLPLQLSGDSVNE